MKSILDKCHGVILNNLNYRNEGCLTIKLTELILSDSKTDLNLGGGKIIKDLNPVKSTSESRQFKVEFREAVFYQVADESYCSWDEYEIRDGKDNIQIFSKSRYMDFVTEHFPFYSAENSKGKHYRLLATTEIIDVIAYDNPTITELKN
ncbi:hypothetical protein GTQ34_16075 [Muricauda sp. JGD-17]|uniref:Uncharacterized protein n=1 Tax=Flagellimonas ochracea TaxID=2696472 RepID=A0A964WZ52_9FLAO|nr:hypothetical protein [Allomuricauda ochracea]NAY93429.1 hypothetical protein [Allomuricauda ochracea]